MADGYDNGYTSSDFKRNAQQDAGNQDGEDGVKLTEKAGEYVRELLSEKIKLSNGKFPVSTRLIDQEVAKVQASGRGPSRDNKYMDVYREKPAKVSVKVLVPLKEHPKFNFVGKLLGPKGNTMKQLQEETMCKMAVLGRGSMRDRQKEEELRNSLDPKYSHLTDELHVEISSIAPPAEAYARIAYALAEVKKYLIPDPVEGPPMGWGQPHLDREMMPPGGRPGPPGHRGPPRPPRMPAPPMGRMPGKTKVISILDRARSAMESNYSYDDPYGAPEPPMRAPPRQQEEFFYDRAPERFYEDDSYYKDDPMMGRSEYKQASSREVGTRRSAPGGPQRHHGGAGAGHSYQRAQPYGRPQKSGAKQRN